MSEQLDEDAIEEAASPGRPGFPVDFSRLIRGVLRFWKIIAAVTLLSIVTGVVLAKTIAPMTYTARTVIVWEPGRDQSRQDLGTLVDSMLIPANLAEVKRRLKLGVPIEALALSVQVFFDPLSDVVSLESSSGTSKGAAQLANTIVAVFLDHCQKLRRTRAEAKLQEVRANLEVARATLTNAQEVYDAFRRENNVTDVSTEAGLAIQEAATLRSRAEAARSEALAEAARARTLEEDARHQQSMVVSSGSQSNPSASALMAVRMELEQARTRLSADHPRVAALEAQIAALEKSAETGTVSSVSTAPNMQLASIKAALSASATARAAALELQQSYTDNATQARDRLQKLSAVEGQAAILLSEVTNASSHVTNLESRLNPIEELLRDTRAEFRVLAPAEEPPYPSSGKGKVYAAGVPAVSLGVLLLALLGMEIRGFRVHTAREAAFWLDGPVIGASTWPRASEAFAELIDEVSDCAQNASGNTLIVGAAPGDQHAALEIAAALRQRTQTDGRITEPGFGSRALIGGATEARHASIDADIHPTAITTVGNNPKDAPAMAIQTWENSQKTVTLRRASRLSDRVIVVLTANTLSMWRLSKLRTQLGRDHGIGILLVGVDPALSDLPDRVGDVDGFWYSRDYEEIA